MYKLTGDWAPRLNVKSIMKNKKQKTKKKVKAIKNPCMECGKEVKWGVDGCPVVKKGEEVKVLLGTQEGMIHYNC